MFIQLLHMLARLCSKSFKLAILNQTLDVQVGFEKDRRTRDQIASICWIIKNASIYFCFIDCVDQNKLCTILKDMGILDHLTCLLRILYEGQEATESYMEQLIGSKLGNKYYKDIYCHLFTLSCMQSTSCEMPGRISYKLESRFLGEISTTLDMQMWQKM